ncbi:DUF2177 family protein [Pyruvatibacter sp.]|uniref:DUF2177 family protein n=1 Tax=Pyruvatibacter sp. TaxID=1981328 RepID=UPI0032ED1596
MTQYLPVYFITAVVFLVLDYVWLGHVARDYYARELGDLMRDTPNFVVAGLFYAIYAAGIVLFAVLPAQNAGSWQVAAALGACLGFLAYGTYDATNLATIKGWPVAMSFVDVTWGTVLTATSASIAYLITAAIRS